VHAHTHTHTHTHLHGQASRSSLFIMSGRCCHPKRPVINDNVQTRGNLLTCYISARNQNASGIFQTWLCWSPRGCGGSGWEEGGTPGAAAPILAPFCVYLFITPVKILDEDKGSPQRNNNQKLDGPLCAPKRFSDHFLVFSRHMCVFRFYCLLH
jgi:hypothetical protein